MSYKLALLYERIMFEASYDGMINSIKATYPDNATEINDNVKWAKATLKKMIELFGF
jgi:hypothetical protein